MQCASSSVTETLAQTNAKAQPRRRDDLTYQAVTVAAILLVLASLWVF